MKPHDAVKIEIGLQGNKLNLDLPLKEFNLIKADLKSNKPRWIQIQMNKGATVDIYTANIQYIKLRPPNVRELTKREGHTLKEICKVLGVNYDVYRQQLKKDGVELDQGAGRRILLTPQTIKKLGLSEQQIKSLGIVK